MKKAVSLDHRAVPAVATFGAALSAMGIAPELQADIVSLSFVPGTVPYQAVSVYVPVMIPEVNSTAPGFAQWNDNVGKSLYLGPASVTMVSLGLASVSQAIVQSTFSTGTAVNPGTTGTVYIAFRSAAGNVGWFSMNLGGTGNPITYLEGAYGNAGEDVHVGTIPAPGGLALLALGAAGVLRNRKRTAA